MKIRCKEYKKGWIVEYERKRLFKSKWLPVTKYVGTNKPFYYKNHEEAINGALKQIRFDIEFSIIAPQFYR